MKVKLWLRAAQRDGTRGVRTFYMPSFTEEGGVYCLKVIRRPTERKITCDCPDFYHRAGPRGVTCKHVRAMRRLVRARGGVSRIEPGETVRLVGGSPGLRPTERGIRVRE